MPANLGTESATVQHPLTRYAKAAGWTIVPRDEALTRRRGESGIFLYDTLKDKLLELNPGIVAPEMADDIVRRLESVRNNIEGNSEILAWLRAERAVYVESEKRHCNITLIDFKDPARNEFHVTEEWQYTNGSKTNRADVVFLINGVPIAIVETKSAKRDKAMEEALAQSNYEAKVTAFFEPRRILELIRDWILFYVKDDELQKTVLRQHQTRAAVKVVARCADPAKATGLVWHTQGSGKTFTMITAARLILERQDIFGKATVVLVIDRNELEGQLVGWVDRLLGELQTKDIKIEHANSKARLIELLKADFRGLIVTMI